jgi:transcriptional regulator GlxA family with amidase domain
VTPTRPMTETPTPSGSEFSIFRLLEVWVLRPVSQRVCDARRPGRDLILESLVEVLLVEAIRFRSASAAREERGLLAGLSDPALARTLREIHVGVARRWTVEQLAHTAGMSRAVFAERFARKVGMPPMQYLLEWRMALAKDMLRGERPSLAEVAERVGYQSASAFSTAFARLTGRSPSEFARSTD